MHCTLKATGKEAALSEYNKLKAAREVNAERDINKDSELEEAARKAATQAVESESKAKVDGIQSEEDKTQVDETVKAEVEKSGIEAATAEVDSFKVEEDLDRSEEEIMEERRAMEEAGRLAAEEEFFKLSRREEESRVAAEDLAERQARAIELVKTAACDAAKDIFVASIVDTDGSDADPESSGTKSESEIHEMLEAAGLEAAEAGFVQFKSSGKPEQRRNVAVVEQIDSCSDRQQIDLENNVELKEKLESVSRKAAQDEFARLKAAAQRIKDLCNLIESAVKKEAGPLFSQLQTESESDTTLAERFEELGISVAQDIQDNIVSFEKDDLSAADADKAKKFGKRVATEELARLKAALNLEASLLIDVEDAAREAARQLFASYCDDTADTGMEKSVASETEKLEEAEKAGIASAGKVLADNPPSGECDGVNGTDGLKDTMESLGARIAKEEFSRLVAEEEEKKKQSEAEHR